ncbi:MAG TPA: VOC family protein [Anaerolineales bacterium]|nr:VOC family protein [Anaerolineales bacterium]
MGPVGLRVRDEQAALDFYEGRLGLRITRDPTGQVLDVASPGGESLLRLWVDPQALRKPKLSTGLYHYALVLPDRASLGVALETLLEGDYPLEGAADHLVSEAVYLADPEGNGIELYRDRPRQEWPRSDGRITMATDPLDAESLLAEGRLRGPARGLAAGTRMGHVHLHVSDLEAAEAFYCGVIGFDLVTRYGGSASFVSAGGYHHHLGMNIWAGRGAPPPPEGSAGLVYTTILLPKLDDLSAVRMRLEGAGVEIDEREGGLFVRDPSHNGVLLRVDEPKSQP